MKVTCPRDTSRAIVVACRVAKLSALTKLSVLTKIPALPKISVRAHWQNQMRPRVTSSSHDAVAARKTAHIQCPRPRFVNPGNVAHTVSPSATGRIARDGWDVDASPMVPHLSARHGWICAYCRDPHLFCSRLLRSTHHSYPCVLTVSFPQPFLPFLVPLRIECLGG